MRHFVNTKGSRPWPITGLCVLGLYIDVLYRRGPHGGGGGSVPAVDGERGVRDDVAGLPGGHVQRRDRGRPAARY